MKTSRLSPSVRTLQKISVTRGMAREITILGPTANTTRLRNGPTESNVPKDEDTKFIGVYRSEEDAIAAIERLKDKPGFAQTSDGFVYERYELNADHWIDGFKEVDALS